MASSWSLVSAWKAKPQGQVWLVKDDAGNRGYFKFAKPEQWQYSGPIIANERIACDLATQLGFPVAQLEEASVCGPDGTMESGIVSIEVHANEVTTWNQVSEKIRLKPEDHVNRVTLLAQVVVFDAWIANIDRAVGKNLVLYRNSSSQKYNWYLIDHGLALYGCPEKWKRGNWNSPLWQKLWIYYHVPKGLLRLQSSLETLDPMIKKIETFPDSHIDSALDQASSHLQTKERQFIRELLLYRKKQIRSIIEAWIHYKGIKEFGGG